MEAMQKGVLAGYPVVNLKADLFDGSYHPVDSSEMAFKVAASLAYKEGLPKASPVLLEPVGKLCVWAPGSMLGDIMGAINKRRGRVLGMSPTQKKGEQMIEAEVPMGEIRILPSSFARSRRDAADIPSTLKITRRSRRRTRRRSSRKRRKTQRIKALRKKSKSAWGAVRKEGAPAIWCRFWHSDPAFAMVW